jgi:hypothetical protein
VKIYCVSLYDPFLKKMDGALYVWLEDETQKWFSVIDDVKREKAMPVKAVLDTVSEVRESSLQGLVLNNAAGHLQSLCPTLLNELAENLCTTTSLLQLFNLGMVVTFKTDYTSCTFESILCGSQKETFVNTSEGGNSRAHMTA